MAVFGLVAGADGRIRRTRFSSKAKRDAATYRISRDEARRIERLEDPAARRAAVEEYRARRFARERLTSLVPFEEPGFTGIITTPELPRTRRGVDYHTWFRAMGSIGSTRDLEDPYRQNFLDEALEDAAAPAQFYSNQPGLLGQVKFEGLVALEDLIARLNAQLQFVGEEERGFDFRLEYPRWSYRYQVIETLGDSRVVLSVSDRRPRRGVL